MSGTNRQRSDHLPDPNSRRILANAAEAASEGTQLLTADDLARRWQLDGGKAAIYRMTRAGQIPTVRLGKFYRYRVADILAFEESGGTVE